MRLSVFLLIIKKCLSPETLISHRSCMDVRTWLQQKLENSKYELVINHLADRSHNINEHPFRHVVIDDAFPESFHRMICAEFDKVISRGLSETPSNPEKLSRIGKYDAYGWCFPPNAESPLSFFYSKEWRDFTTNLFGIPCTDDTEASFHHHKVGSQSGWTHNDYTAMSFRDTPPGKINPWYFNCPLQTDVPMPDTHVGVRALAILYYFGKSGEWREGDGGDTGIYANKNRDSIATKVSPIPNRLLLFEVSPRSYHAFITNLRLERNVIVQWFHQDPKTSLERFGVPYEKWKPRKSILVLTGASGKLGLHFAERYSQYYDIIGVSRHKPVSTKHFVDYIVQDITHSPHDIIAEILSKHGAIDVLVNNAVTYHSQQMLEKSREVAREEFETNLFAPYELIRETYHQFWKHQGKAANNGQNRNVVNVSSLAGLSTFPDSGGIYSASKSALNSLTAHFALELKDIGIRVNSIAPAGFTNKTILENVAKQLALAIETSTSGAIFPPDQDSSPSKS